MQFLGIKMNKLPLGGCTCLKCINVVKSVPLALLVHLRQVHPLKAA